MSKIVSAIWSTLIAIVNIIAAIIILLFSAIAALLVTIIFTPAILLFGKRIEKNGGTVYKLGKFELRLKFSNDKENEDDADKRKANQENVKGNETIASD